MRNFGYNVSAKKCEKKWANLKDTYIKKKQAINQTGNSRQYWEFYDEIDKVLGPKQSTAPDTINVGDTMGNKSDEEEEATMHTSKRKKSNAQLKMELQKQKFEHQKEAAEKMQKEMSEQTTVLKSLLNVLQQKND